MGSLPVCVAYNSTSENAAGSSAAPSVPRSAVRCGPPPRCAAAHGSTRSLGCISSNTERLPRLDPMDATGTLRLTELYPPLANLDAAARDAVLAHKAQHVTGTRGDRAVPGGRPLPQPPARDVGCRPRGARFTGWPHARAVPPDAGRTVRGVHLVPVRSRAAGRPRPRGQTTELVLLSPTAFDRWVRHEPFHRFVFGLFGVFAARLAARRLIGGRRAV